MFYPTSLVVSRKRAASDYDSPGLTPTGTRRFHMFFAFLSVSFICKYIILKTVNFFVSCGNLTKSKLLNNIEEFDLVSNWVQKIPKKPILFKLYNHNNVHTSLLGNLFETTFHVLHLIFSGFQINKNSFVRIFFLPNAYYSKIQKVKVLLFSHFPDQPHFSTKLPVGFLAVFQSTVFSL